MTMAVVSSSSSSSSSSSFPKSYKYDVFISFSFRGEDTRNNFTSYLYGALCENQIETYIDEESLKKGERISELLTAIEESRLSLIVFSKDYAASRWCLDELVKILECKKRGQIVIPIFYHVDPTNIRHQRRSYGKAFLAHKKRFKHDMNKVEEWRNALKEAADLSGFHLLEDHHSEAKFVKKIVEDVLERLYNLPSRNVVDDFQGLIGIRKRLERIESLLCVGSQDVRIVGIWGMGGIGKTTLAQALYKRFSSEFESCFFTNVKEDVCKHGLDSLMEKMFCKLLKRESVDMDSSFKDDQLRRRKVLVVLDNVDKFRQLECLVGENDVPLDVFQRKKGRFGVGSRIIITSRDEKLLQRKAYDKIYKVDALDSNEAHSLFYLKAFKRGSLVTDYIDLVERVLDYAKGIPLALEVLGSYLHSRTKEEWESALSELKRAPNERIQEVLRISYDALDHLKKSIFLDIACFFKGQARDFAEEILGSESHIGINVLIEKSLITIKNDTLQMHDLIQEMGWEIVRQESHNEDGERSRLWVAKEVFQALENNKGTKSIEGIFLDMSKIDEDLRLASTAFEAMSNLRLLKIYSSYVKNKKKCKLVHLHQGLCHLPNSLRYLNWCSYPLKTLPIKFRPESLVELEMPNSHLKQLWDGVQPLRNLKRIDLRYSRRLVKIPDFSQASSLLSVNLEGCESLNEIPPLIFQLRSGVTHASRSASVNPTGWESVVEIFAQLMLQARFVIKDRGYLNLSDCTNLKSLPEISGDIGCLYLRGTGIKELPSSISSSESLFYLDLHGCRNLKIFPELPRHIESLDLSSTPIREIPSDFCKLKSLRDLNLGGCANLKNFPEILEPMENLIQLRLHETGIEKLSSSFANMNGLRELSTGRSRNLKLIPKCLSTLRNLTKVDLSYCHISEIPHWIGSLSSMTTLDLKGNIFTSIPSSIKQLRKLFYLNISYCNDLRSLPELPWSITELKADGCLSMETLLTSGPKLNLEYWIRYPATDVKFSFCECLKLVQSACNIIEMGFLCRVICTAIIPRDVADQKSKVRSTIMVCYPGNRIPKWMSHQSEGSSTITIELPPSLHSSNFTGFVVCVVLSFQEVHWYQIQQVNIWCRLHNYGCFSVSIRNNPRGDEEEILRSDHVFMWYIEDNFHYLEKCDAVEMSFDVYFGKHSDSVEYELPFKYKVKGCGVHMLYVEKVPMIKDFYNMSYEQRKEYVSETEEHWISILQNIIVEDDSDAVINEPKPTATQDIDFNTEESCFERVTCFDFCRCSSFFSKILDWIQGNRGN